MTSWRPNEPTANARTCLVYVTKDDGTPAPRGTDFKALGYLFFGGVNLPSLDAAAGTLVNIRRVLPIVAFTFTADSATDELHAVAHGLETGDGAALVSNAGGGLPAPLAAATDYYVIKVDADNFKLATTLANAYAGVAIDITTNGTGVQTLSEKLSGPTVATQRGIAGQFLYTATQPETSHTFAESQVVIDGPVGSGYERANGGGALTLIAMDSAGDVWSQLMENGLTYGDGMRIQTRTDAAKISITGTDYKVRDLADTKDSHGGTLSDSAGRTAANVIDPT